MTDVRARSEEWIAEHGRFLRRLSRAVLQDEARAEDAVQEAWVAALEAPPIGNLVGWLVTVTRRLALRSDREVARRHARERAVARQESQPAADSAVARSEIVRLVAVVVADLPEPFRETLLLRFWEGLPPRRIAERLEVPVATVHSRTRRGLERVRRELERRAPREGRWRESLALAVGLFPPIPSDPAPTLTTLGALGMKAKAQIAGACALLALTLATAVGVSLLRADAAVDGSAGSARPTISEADPLPTAAGGTSMEPASPPRVAAASTPEGPGEVAAVVVRVVDASGAPVEGAEVLGGPSAGELQVLGRTAGEGRALLEPTPRLLVLCSRADGWAPSPVYDLSSLGEATGELVLQLPMRGTSLLVAVRDPSGGPLHDALVFAGREEELDYRLPDGTLARTAPGFQVRTDADGLARFGALPPGWLRVHVEHEAFASATAFATLELGRDERLTVELEPGFQVVGRVRDEAGAPVAGATIKRGSRGPVAVSAWDGSFRLGPVGAGKAVAVGPLGRRVEQRLGGPPGTVVRWDPVLRSQPAVLGRVVDAQGAALEGWVVGAVADAWPGWRRMARTDARGRFAIHGAPTGALRIEVRDEAAAVLPLSIREGVEAGPGELLIRVRRDARAGLSGRVERADGEPAAELSLFLRPSPAPGRPRPTGGEGLAVRPAPDGGFELADLPLGAYELVLEGAPFGWHRLARFELGPEGTELGTLAVPRTGTLVSRARWGSMLPTGDARFLLERRADLVTVLSFRGTFPEALRLAPGRYTLQTEVTPGPLREIEFVIDPGELTEIELDLAESCEHRLRVRYASGREPKGEIFVQVRLVGGGSVPFSGPVNAVESGAWALDLELTSGRFEFFVSDAAGREVRITERLFTSRPGREIALTLVDEERSR